MPSTKATPTGSNAPTPRKSVSAISTKGSVSGSRRASGAPTPRNKETISTPRRGTLGDHQIKEEEKGPANIILSPRTSAASQQPWKKIHHGSRRASDAALPSTEVAKDHQVPSASGTPRTPKKVHIKDSPSVPTSARRASTLSGNDGASQRSPRQTSEAHTATSITNKKPSNPPSKSVSPRGEQAALPFSPPRRMASSTTATSSGREGSLSLSHLSESDRAVAAGLYRVLLPNTMIDALQGVLDETHWALFGSHTAAQAGENNTNVPLQGGMLPTQAEEIHRLLMAMSATLASEGQRLHAERKVRLQSSGVSLVGGGANPTNKSSEDKSADGVPAWRSSTPDTHHNKASPRSEVTTPGRSPSAPPLRIVTRASIVAESAKSHDRSIPYSKHSPSGSHNRYSPENTLRSVNGYSASPNSTLRVGSPSLSGTTRQIERQTPHQRNSAGKRPKKVSDKKREGHQKSPEPPVPTIPTAKDSPSPTRPSASTAAANSPSQGKKSATAAPSSTSKARTSKSPSKRTPKNVDVPVRSNTSSSQQLAWGRLVAAVEAQTAAYSPSDTSPLTLTGSPSPADRALPKESSHYAAGKQPMNQSYPASLLSREDLKLLSLPTIERLAEHYVANGRLKKGDVEEITAYWVRAHRGA